MDLREKITEIFGKEPNIDEVSETVGLTWDQIQARRVAQADASVRTEPEWEKIKNENGLTWDEVKGRRSPVTTPTYKSDNQIGTSSGNKSPRSYEQLVSELGTVREHFSLLIDNAVDRRDFGERISLENTERQMRNGVYREIEKNYPDSPVAGSVRENRSERKLEQKFNREQLKQAGMEISK